MGQSKLSSFIESVCNTLSGFLLSFALMQLLVWLYGIKMSSATSAEFVLWFTLLSVARNYFIRRVWNARPWVKTDAR